LNLKRIILISTIIIFSILLGHYLLRHFDISVFTRISISDSVIVLLIIALYSLSGLFYFSYIFRCLGYHPPLGKLFVILTGSYSLNFAGPVKIGIPIRIYLLKEILKIPVIISTSTIAIRQLFDMISLSIIGLCTAPFFLPDLNTYHMATALVLFIISLFFFFRCSQIFARLFRRTTKVSAFFSNLHDNFSKLRLTHSIIIVLISLARFYVLAMGTFYIARALGDHSNYFLILGAEAVALFIGIISFMPMGIGAKDISLGVLLVKAGIDGSIVTAIVAIERSLNLGFSVVLGIVMANIIGFKHKIGENCENVKST